MDKNIKVARVDNRYIHGQVAARLIREFSITKVLVINDLYAKDMFMSQLMKTMSFSGAVIEVLSIADAADQWNRGLFENDNVMLVWGDVDSAYNTYYTGLKYDSLNIGNLPGGPGRVKVDKSNYISAQDAEQLKDLDNSGVSVYFQAMPDLSRVDLPEALVITKM